MAALSCLPIPGSGALLSQSSLRETWNVFIRPLKDRANQDFLIHNKARLPSIEGVKEKPNAVSSGGRTYNNRGQDLRAP